MGLLGNLIKNTVSEGISKGIGDAVSKAAEKAFSPVAEKIANKAADQLDEATDNIEANQTEIKSGLAGAIERLEAAAQNYSDATAGIAGDAAYAGVLKNFPKWTLSPIKDISGDDGDGYVSARVTVDLNDEMVDEYQKILKENGFEGDSQIMKKVIDGITYNVDFSFVQDSEINYLISK